MSNLRLLLAQATTRGEAKRVVPVVTERTTREKRTELLESWAKIDSKIRILIVSPFSDYEVLIPDVGTLVALSDDGPEAMSDRWQRMARMSEQKGQYIQLVPQPDKDQEMVHNWADDKTCH